MLNPMIKKQCKTLVQFDAVNRMNNEKSCIDTVQVSYSNICCEGCSSDINNHWFPKIWPNAKRSPYCDLFHAKKNNDST